MVGDVSFFLKDTATTEIYTYGHTLSLHVALPIWVAFDERRDLPLPIGPVHRVDLRRDPERQSRTRGDADRPVGTLFGGNAPQKGQIPVAGAVVARQQVRGTAAVARPWPGPRRHRQQRGVGNQHTAGVRGGGGGGG